MDNPYKGLPDHQFWRRSVAGIEPFLFDPVVRTRFVIGKQHQVATAGSCFAQHISHRLAINGFNYFVTEAGGHEVAPVPVKIAAVSDVICDEEAIDQIKV